MTCSYRCIATIALIAFMTGCSNKPPSFVSMDTSNVEVHLTHAEIKGHIETEDPAKIDALFDALRPGTPTPDHKCGDSGRITIRRKSGGDMKIGILPGHSPEYYEYRVFSNDKSGYQMFRIPRKPFVAAMHGLGLAKIDEGQPE